MSNCSCNKGSVKEMEMGSRSAAERERPPPISTRNIHPQPHDVFNRARSCHLHQRWMTVGFLTEMTETKSTVTCSLLQGLACNFDSGSHPEDAVFLMHSPKGLRFGHVKNQTTLSHPIIMKQNFNQKLTSPDSLSMMLITELLTKSQKKF